MSSRRRLARTSLPVLLLMCAGRAAAAEPGLAWQVLEQQTPRLFWADRNADVTLRLRNVGTATWSEEKGDHLSYHWLKRDGTVVEKDGMRARLPGPVLPGEAVEVTARVRAPGSAGRWLLQWEMVREQVAWFGPPAGGAPPRVSVLVVWRCAFLQVGFGLAVVALALVLRRSRPAAGAWAWLLVEAAPVLWAWAAIALLTLTFSEVGGRQLWRGGGVLVASASALLAFPLVLVPGRVRAWAAAVLVGLASGVAIGDAVYFRYFGTVVPVVALATAGQLGRVEGSVRALLRPGDIWLAVSVANALAFALLWPHRRPDEAPERRKRLAVSAALAALCVISAAPALRNLRAAIRDPATADQVFSQRALIERWGLVNVHLFDVWRTYREWMTRSAPDPAEEATVSGFLARKAAISAAAAAKYGVARGANLLLIQVESLQQWVIGARVGGAEITPYLNALRSRALCFPYLFDQSGQGRSSDGEFAALNSQHALDRGAVAFRRPGNRFVALPGILKEHGYATLSAHAFEKGFWNRGVVHPRYGFERMIFGPDLGPGEVIGWGLADGVFLGRMVKPLSEERQPFFAFLITLGLHHPFDLFPDRHKVLDVGELRGTPLGNYIHAMHYFDASLESFMAQLEEAGLLANTVVALYGDHEAGLWIEEHVLALAGEGRWDASVLVRLRRVPFFVLVPGQRLAGEFPLIGGHVDIAPTLLALLGLPSPPCFVGQALDPANASIAVLNDGSVVGEGLVFVAEGPLIPSGGACFAWPDGAPRRLEECRDLARRGKEELAASRFVVMHDRAREIAGLRSP